MTSILDAGKLPIEDLASLALREGRRPRSYYQVHRWFARRLGANFRALLVASVTEQGKSFWKAYYASDLLKNKSILDPFMGGGTSIIEAQRLGAKKAIGIDIDPVACAITHFESQLFSMPTDIDEMLEGLVSKVGEKIKKYYQTRTTNGEIRTVLHYFWVQVVECPQCEEAFEAHPHYQLAYDADAKKQWFFCPYCHTIEYINLSKKTHTCRNCKKNTTILEGTVNEGVACCPCCGHHENLIDLHKTTKSKPQWKLFALETLEPPFRKKLPLKQRVFRTTTTADLKIFQQAQKELSSRQNPDGTIQWIPNWDIPTEGRSDNRIIKYGYSKYSDLFNPRQLLHLSLLAEEIEKMDEPYKHFFSIAFSDHLTTNCMLTNYAFGWRRLAPLFSLRSYRHIPRPVELNPWIDGTGRGTYPNTVRQIKDAVLSIKIPKEPTVEGGFRILEQKKLNAQGIRITNGSSQALANIRSKSIDIVLTDPPYFDNIAYSELSDFYLPWLVQLGIVKMDKKRSSKSFGIDGKLRSKTSAAEFENMLSDCFEEASRVLKKDGIVIFTFQHAKHKTWLALAGALSKAKLKAIQVLPLLGDSKAGLHKQTKVSSWDAVFVLRKISDAKDQKQLIVSNKQVASINRFYERWLTRLRENSDIPFTEEDAQNYYKACLVAGALGFLSKEPSRSEENQFLSDLLTKHKNTE